MRDWWYDAPYARPRVTSGLALAAVLPVAFIAFGGSRSAVVKTVPPTPTARVITASTGNGDGALEQIWAEHASSDPLGDNSGPSADPDIAAGGRRHDGTAPSDSPQSF
jgi:hypothetical protein